MSGSKIIELVIELAPILASAFLALVGYLAKSYLEDQKRMLLELKYELKRSEGRFDAVLHEIRANTTELIKVRSELQAVWRFIDHEKEGRRGRSIG
jgi:hypothetical protein